MTLQDAPSNESLKEEVASATPPVEAGKIDTERRRAPTFSADLTAWLIEQQRSKAMLVQALCDRLAMARMATQKEAG